jgi:hypothetical protein
MTGYVFRVENQATVRFLQKVGQTGCLTMLNVAPITASRKWIRLQELLYLVVPLLTCSLFSLFFAIEDWWACLVISVLVLARLCNVLVIRRRAQLGWKGASEPGVRGDLLVLLSQDRWIRIQGFVDDLKAVTSGQWLRDMTFVENAVVTSSNVLVYLSVTFASNASQAGKLLLPFLFLFSAALVAITNQCTNHLHMQGRVVQGTDANPKKYGRRLDLAADLIRESGRDDWALRLGMINAELSRNAKGVEEGITL